MSRRPVLRVLVTLAMTSALTLAARQYISAEPHRGHPEWPMGGHDIANTRSQPAERYISSRNANQLPPRWALTTAGDVSAPPAVSRESDHGNGLGNSTLFLYFPDWGGRLWKLEAEIGRVVWSRQISEYVPAELAIIASTPSGLGSE